MNPMNEKNIRKTFVLQHDQSDCGVACLLSLIRYYGGTHPLEKLRELSGTTRQGTTLLGLYQAANQLGFNAEGFEAGIGALKGHNSPVILHVLMEDHLQHFLVCYGYQDEKFIIGDPAKGILRLSAGELKQIWQSNALLTLTPHENFVQKKEIRASKRNWIRKLIREDINILSISVFIGIVVAVLGMVMAIFSQKLIDDILPSENMEKLIMGIILVGILLIVRSGAMALRQFFLLTQGKNFNNRIIHVFYSTLVTLPKPFFDTRRIGELVARLNDTVRIQTVISQIAGNLIIDFLVSITAIVFLFTYYLPFGFIALISMPFYFLWVYKFNKPIIAAQKDVMATYANTESYYINSMQGISAIKNHNRESSFSKINQMVYGHFQDKIFHLGKINIRLGLITNIFGTLFLIAILAFGSYYVLRNMLTLGELMAVLGIASTLIPSITNLALIAIPVNEASVAFHRMFEFVDIEPEQKTSGKEMPPFESLSLKQISFRFPGRKPLLRDISLDIRLHSIVALVGESGSGKSTLCQLLEKFYAPESGEIQVNGNLSLKDVDTAGWRKILGVVPQDIPLFNGTVLDNIALGDSSNVEEVVQFCRETGVEKFIQQLPQGYGTILGEEGINLSGGQKQIIGLARALYKKPQFLILDEATAALDRQTENFVIGLLLRLKEKMSILFISHRLNTLKKIADDMYILEEGMITHQGTHETLMQSDNFYSRYWKELEGIKM